MAAGRKLLLVTVISGLAAALTVIGLDLHGHDRGPSATGHSAAGKPVCGQPVLRSPFHYDGPPGPYASRRPGLPTYGTPGSDFPHATAGVILPAGRRSYASYQLRPRTVYYLLPGKHVGAFMANAGDVEAVFTRQDGQWTAAGTHWHGTGFHDPFTDPGGLHGLGGEAIIYSSSGSGGGGTSLHGTAAPAVKYLALIQDGHQDRRPLDNHYGAWVRLLRQQPLATST